MIYDLLCFWIIIISIIFLVLEMDESPRPAQLNPSSFCVGSHGPLLRFFTNHFEAIVSKCAKLESVWLLSVLGVILSVLYSLPSREATMLVYVHHSQPTYVPEMLQISPNTWTQARSKARRVITKCTEKGINMCVRKR